MTCTILLTGFGSFPSAPFNPTGPLVERLGRSRRLARPDLKRIVHVFRTAYAAVDRDLAALLERDEPDAVVMFGLAARTPHLRIETTARNAMSLMFPDAAGVTPRRAVIDPGAPQRRGGRAPFRQLLAAARATRIKVALSRDAGRYLCNYVYWRAATAAAGPDGPRLVVFVHVPSVRRGGRRTGAHAIRPTAAALARAGEAVVRAVISTLDRDRAAPATAQSPRR